MSLLDLVINLEAEEDTEAEEVAEDTAVEAVDMEAVMIEEEAADTVEMIDEEAEDMVGMIDEVEDEMIITRLNFEKNSKICVS